MKTSAATELLKKVELKITQARLGVLETLMKQQQPLSAQDILEVLTKKRIAVDQATVYRIVETFYVKKLINRMEFHEGKFRYEFVQNEHHHLICQNCGDIADITNCPINRWEKTILKKQHFLVKQHALEFFGLCRNCQL